MIACAAIIACMDTRHAVLPPSEIEGATIVGAEACGACHIDVHARFALATHAVLSAHDQDGNDVSCESCHGAGSVHVVSAGAPDAILNPKRSPEPCFRCHTNIRGELALPHSHPVSRGPLGLTRSRMSCGDCHEPHTNDKSEIAGLTSTSKQSEKCTGCHPAEAGPHVFEHEALREGCTTCHEPHGSVNPKMLTERNSTLCLKCHFQEQASAGTILIGGRDHSFFLSRGTCFSAGCHEAVHGSNASSSLRF